MNTNTCFIISLSFFAISVIIAFIKWMCRYKRGSILTPSRILFGGVICASFVLYLPLLYASLEGSKFTGFDKIAISFYNMIRLFIIEGNYEDVLQNLVTDSDNLYKAYTVLFSVLSVLAAVLTFGFVMSFFRNISAYRKYFFHYWSDAYIFSHLSEKSLALAESLSCNKSKSRILVFTNVTEELEEQNEELVGKARELGAVCFKKDIVSVNFNFHSKKKELNFFTIGENETENVALSIKLLSDFGHRDKTNLYVFSTQVEAEMLLARAFNDFADNTKIKVRRINEVQSLVIRTLYETGYEKIFLSAYDDGSVEKRINAVVIGMGQHGTEMTKALSWFCQMDGYLPTIHSFDIDPLAEEKFTSQCPELMEFSGKLNIPGETQYTIKIHSGIDVNTITFDKLIAALPRTTYVFVALGNDDKNIAVSVKLRAIFEQLGYNPVIQTVVYDSEKKEALRGITNYKNQPYCIDFIGDRKSSYSEQVILKSDIEQLALSRHLKWGEEHQFWQYNYNYKSSIASVIHTEMKRACGIPEIDVAPKERSDKARRAIRVLEHRRWNAYMRSEGFVYSGSIEGASRNDLAKKHNCLVPFDDLLPAEKEKDDD